MVGAGGTAPSGSGGVVPSGNGGASGSAGALTGGSGGTGGVPVGGSAGSSGGNANGGNVSSGGAGALGGQGGVGGGSAAGGGSGSGGATGLGGPGIVGQHGALHVKGNRVVDSAGRSIQLRGMSLFWSQWSTFYGPSTVDQLVDDWHATLVRSVLGVENTGGYLQSPSDNESKVLAVVDRAIQRGIYVLIDWHDSTAQSHQSASIDFFKRMAAKYGSAPGVIFEIYNEPVNVDWPTVKSYAEAVIGAIRGAGAKNLIIVGTPNWSQDVDIASGSPITDYTDVAYTLHFYAATHKQALRDKATKALGNGMALFVTEWGTCTSTGNGALDPGETSTWMSFLSQNSISWANWSLNDKAESCSALTPTAGTSGPWTGSKLTASGALVKPLIQ